MNLLSHVANLMMKPGRLLTNLLPLFLIQSFASFTMLGVVSRILVSNFRFAVRRCPQIEENKENIDMSRYELRLLEAFCEGKEHLEAEIPSVMNDIVKDNGLDHQARFDHPSSRTAGSSRSPLPSGFPRAPLQDITHVFSNHQSTSVQVRLHLRPMASELAEGPRTVPVQLAQVELDMWC